MEAALALVFLLSAGCASEPDVMVSERSEVIRRELQNQIAEGAPETAIQRISALRREEILSQPELDGLEGRAVERMALDLEKALAEDRLDAAIRLYGNLEILDQQIPAGPDINELYLRLARRYVEEDNGPAAVATLLRTPELSSLPAPVLEDLARGAMALNNRYAVRVAVELLGNHWLRENDDVERFLAEPGSPVGMVGGMATIWVNRGIRLEGGIGYPDRVVGSGFFIDPRGYLITNYHVISSEVDPAYEGYSRLFVRLPADPAERIPARVVGYTRIFDIALLKVEVDPDYVFSFTEIRSLEPGSRIYAIGSPGGLESTITSGIISATGRRFLQMGDALQVDVPINPGSSGGPLIDAEGNVVGVVFAGIEQFEGVNFAIPSFWLQNFLPRLYSQGEVTHPWMGVAVEQVPAGLEVSYVDRESPAAAAGLRVGDVITGLAGWPAEKIGSAQRAILAYDAGSLVPATWLRDGEEIESLIALAERPWSPAEAGLDGNLHERLFPVLFGMQVSREGGVPFMRRYRVDKVYRGSIADETGITAGDTFTERDFSVDRELRIAYLRIVVKKRTEGFMQTSIQLPAYLETDNFL